MYDPNNTVLPSPKLNEIFRKKAKWRLCLTLTAWIMFAGFALGYGFLHTIFNEKIAPGSNIPFALLYFIALIIISIGLEFLYLKIVDKLELTEKEINAKQNGIEKKVYNYAS